MDGLRFWRIPYAHPLRMPSAERMAPSGIKRTRIRRVAAPGAVEASNFILCFTVDPTHLICVVSEERVFLN